MKFHHIHTHAYTNTQAILSNFSFRMCLLPLAIDLSQTPEAASEIPHLDWPRCVPLGQLSERPSNSERLHT